jgi:hypothetical protein
MVHGQGQNHIAPDLSSVEVRVIKSSKFNRSASVKKAVKV